MSGLASSSGFWIGIGLAVLVYEAYVIVLVLRSRAYSYGQQVSQVVLMVFVPVLGAVVAHWFATQGIARLPQSDRAFGPREVDGA